MKNGLAWVTDYTRHEDTVIECPRCRGTGTASSLYIGEQHSNYLCPNCDGKGYKIVGEKVLCSKS